MSEITKEEIALLVEVQGRAAVNLEKIAASLKDLTEEQEDIAKIQKQLYEEVISGKILTKLDKLHFDVVFSKYLFSSISIIVIVAYVVIRLIQGA